MKKQKKLRINSETRLRGEKTQMLLVCRTLAPYVLVQSEMRKLADMTLTCKVINSKCTSSDIKPYHNALIFLESNNILRIKLYDRSASIVGIKDIKNSEKNSLLDIVGISISTNVFPIKQNTSQLNNTEINSIKPRFTMLISL